MRIIIIDCRADAETIKSLELLGYTVIRTMLSDCVYDAIASHADIQIHYLGSNRFVCAPQCYDYYRNSLPDEIEIIKGSAWLKDKYPYNIAYNAASVGNTLICNSAYTALEILKTYSYSKRNILNVRQGYAKCSVCVVGENSIITSDTGIWKAAEKAGMDVLKISEGNIKLTGMSYGFIGGATGLIENNLLAFNGELKLHPDGNRIKEFCNERGIETIELKKGVLKDIGTIISNI